jgi:hypothetical protein
MDLHKMIVELESERDRLNQAIFALEQLSAGKAKKRGRPPKWLQPDRSDLSNHLPAETDNTDSSDV